MEAAHPSALVVFASRESMAVFAAALTEAMASCHEAVTIDVVINGNPTLVDESAQWLATHAISWRNRQVRLWSIATGDKGNAWNQYVHHIWDGEALVYFMDGYVRLRSDAVSRLERAMMGNPGALGGTGVPSVGRATAQLQRQMLREGGFHGNFCCIRGTALAELKQRGIRIPLGMYRVDSLMGGMLMFGLRPSLAVWDSSRIAVAPEATWLVDEKHWWRWRDVKAKLKQVVRQAQGRAENLAVKHIFVSQGADPEALPRTVQQLLLGWLKVDEENAKRLLARSALARFAVRQCLQRPVAVEADCQLSRRV